MEQFMYKKIILLVGLLLSTNSFATITTDVRPYNFTCQVAYPCKVGAIHSIRIVNDTNTTQTYNWFFSVQAINGDVVHRGGNVTLPPGQEWRQDKIINEGFMKFNIRGRKVLTCTTQADGYEHNNTVKYAWVDVN